MKSTIIHSALFCLFVSSISAEQRVTIKNDVFSASIARDNGGSLTSLRHVSWKSDLVSGPSFVDTLRLPGRGQASLAKQSYEIVVNDEKSVTLKTVLSPESGDGKIAGFAGLQITKRFWMVHGAAKLGVDYEFTNTGRQELSVCLGTQVSLAAEPADKLSVPTRFGAVTYPVPTGRLPFALGGGRYAFLYDLAECWFGAVTERGKSTIVGFDPDHASCLMVPGKGSTVEVIRTTIKLMPAASFKTAGWLTSQKGLKRITGAQGGLVAEVSVPAEADGSLPLGRLEYRDRMSKVAAASLNNTIGTELGGTDELPEDDDIDAFVEEEESGGATHYKGPPIQVRLKLVPAMSQNVQVKWSLRGCRSDEWKSIGENSLTLTAGKIASLNNKVTLKKKGTYAVRAEVWSGEQSTEKRAELITAIEHPIIAGVPSGFYVRAASQKSGEVYGAFKGGLWVPSDEVKRFPLPIGKKLHGGPVRMLFATPYWTSRGLVEIRHRMDIEVDAVIGGGYYYITGDERASSREVEAMRMFLNKPHEVIVFAVNAGDYFPFDVMDEVFRQVEHEGVGLVFVNVGNHLGELDALLDALKKTGVEEEDPSIFPRLKTGRLGKGRIAVNTEPFKYARPFWYGESESEMQQLLHTITWAARGAPAIKGSFKDLKRTVSNTELASQPLIMQLRNSGKAQQKGKVRLRFRRNMLRAYPFYQTGNQFAYRPQVGWEHAAPAMEQSFSVGAGRATQVTFRPPLLPACEYDLDIQMLDENDAVLHWKSIPQTLTNESQVKQVTLKTGKPGSSKSFDFSTKLTNKWFRADAVETLQITCEVETKGEAVQARLQGFDPWGRMPFDQQVPLTTDAKKTVAAFTQPLHSCVHLICVLRFSLLDDQGRELSEQRLLSFVSTPPKLRPKFELRGYAEVRVANDVTDYEVRVGGEGPLTLAWHNVRKADYGGFIPMAEKILEPGYKPLALPGTGDLAASLDLGGKRKEDNEDIVDEFEKKEIDPKKGWYRVPCYNNPTERKKILDGVRGSYEAFSACYPYAGFAIDEFVYAKEHDPSNKVSFFRRSFIPQRDMNICRCQHCLAAFIKYAKGLFGEDLSKLNMEWGTAFKSWKEVDPPLTAVDNVTPPPPAKWQHILAHRNFITQHVSDLMTEVDHTIKQVHPECLTGFSGLWKTGITMGVDIYQLSKNMIYNMLYGDIDMWTDFGRSQAVRWTGYGRKYRLLQGNVGPYREILADQTGVGFYGKWLNPMHRADYTFHPEPMRFFNEVRNIKESGIDRLVTGRRYRDPIALYYSPRDINLAQLEDWYEDAPKFVAGMRNCGRSYNEFCSREYGTYRALLRGRRLQPFWTAYAHLEEGHFGERFGTPKVLFLPYAQTLSRRQIETLRKFVSAGGVLIGDVNTGRRNEHGRAYGTSPMDEIFGLKRTGEYQMRHRTGAASAEGTVTFSKAFGDEPFSMKFSAVGPGDVVVNKAKALASYDLGGKSHPAFLVNDFGEGKAVYLNFIPSGYVAVELSGEGEVSTTKTLEGKAGEYFHRCFDKILKLAAIEEPMKFVGRSLGSARFGKGDLTYIGVVSGRSLESLRVPYQIQIPEKKHVYSVRTRQYLGYHDLFTFKLDEKTRRAGDIISLLPYKVEGLDVEARSSVRPGEKLSFAVRVLPDAAQSQRHVIAVRAVDPKGNDLHWYRHSVETDDGVASSFIGIPANAPIGKWILYLTDTASGVTRDVPFQVKN
jgi:hypothetical protein